MITAPPHSLISVIIPVFNNKRYIDDCINSILQQTYTNIEILLIDDGSTDGSSNICDIYGKQDNRVIVIHQKNKGVSNARNKGIKISKGEYITFVDSDDKVDCNYISNFNLGYDISIQGYKSSNSNLHTLYKETAITTKFSNYWCNNKFHSGVWGKMYKRSIINKYNIIFPENLSFSEDTIFNLKYILHINSGYISSKIGYLYTQDNNKSLTHKKYSIDLLMQKESMIYHYYQLISQNNNEKIFLRNAALNTIAKYYFDHHLLLKNIMKYNIIKEISNNYLKKYEKKVLKISYPLFAHYVRFRNRIYKYIFRKTIA